MTQISQIHTACKNCVFAEYDQNTQIGCGLEYLDIYQQKNIQILEVFDYDKEFYVLNDKKCIGYRENKWLENFDLVNSSVEDRVSKFRSINTIDYVAIVDTKDLTIDDLQNVIDQLQVSKILPKKLFIVRYADNQNFKFDELYKILQNLEYPWKMYTCVDDSPFSFFMDSTIAFNKQARFILNIIKPSQDIVKVITTANDIVHNKLDNFIILGNKDQTCLIFSAAVYKYGKVTGDNIFDNADNYKEI